MDTIQKSNPLLCRTSGRFWVWLAAGLLSLAPVSRGQVADREVLAKVNLAVPVAEVDLPVHAWLRDASGQDYWLVICAESRLAKAGPYQVLADNPSAEEYLLARPRRPGARAAVAGRYPVLLDDGIRLLLRANSTDVEDLAELGFGIRQLSRTPVHRLPATAEGSEGAMQRRRFDRFSPDARIASLMQRVDRADLLALLKRVGGEEPVLIGGEPYTIATRNTSYTAAIAKATQFAYERLQALGLTVAYHNWSSSAYSSRNVVGIQRGNALSNEVVLVTAHLDDMPRAARAPGADDNASGSVAVLNAAKTLSQCRCDRTVRFVLFTGEEQGLLGSEKYAAEAVAAGDNIVAVLNLDMLAWNGSGAPALRLHTRTSSNSAHTNDLAIAAVFTNVVAAYGLSNSLVPVVTPDADDASDHASFWDHGYAALYAEEDYPGDFNPYYHTTNDTVARVSLDYFTAYTRAVFGTVAHLARLTDVVPREAIEIASSDWTPGSGVGAGAFVARRDPGATESGPDPLDVAWTNAPANPDAKWLRLFTAPYGLELQTDSRPTGGTVVFQASLAAVDTTGAGVSCTNRLRFDFLTPPDLNYVYTARLHIDGRFTQPPTDFDCVTNLLTVISNGGYVTLPRLSQATNGVVYGTVSLTVSNLPPLTLVAGPTITNGLFWARFAGVPGVSYAILTAPRLTGPWATMTNLLVGATGTVEFLDPVENVSAKFYRPVGP